VLYLDQRVPRLQEELRIRHGSGTFGKWLIQLAKTDVLVLDGWGMGDATITDALLDRIMQCHHRFNLTGDSLRKTTTKVISE
jgi:DNA replication protein DnaC